MVYLLAIRAALLKPQLPKAHLSDSRIGASQYFSPQSINLPMLSFPYLCCNTHIYLERVLGYISLGLGTKKYLLIIFPDV